MLNPKDFCCFLLEEKIDFFCGIPDSLLKEFNLYIQENISKENHIITSNEGAAVALASGYYLATKKIPLVYMQNSGQGNALNPLISLTDKEVYGIPLILLIGWRGEPGINDEPQHIQQGKITLKLLEVLNIDYEILPKNIEDAKKVSKKLIKIAKEKNSPVALIVKKDTFLPYKNKKDSISNYEITREEAITEIIKNLEEKDIVVSTTGKTSREVFEVRKSLNQNHEKDFLTIGSMGHSSQIALGISLNKKNRQIYCLDGDGSFIMHMGSVATIGKMKVQNLKHIVFNNGAHESVGGQPTAGFCIDISKIAKACCYENVWVVKDLKDLKEKIFLLKNSKGPSLLEIRTNLNSRKNLGRPTKKPIENKKDFMNFLEK